MVVAGSQPVSALQVEIFQRDNTRWQLILCIGLGTAPARVFTLEEWRKLPDCQGFEEFSKLCHTMSVRLLLAEDHNLVRQGLKALLERQGFHVVCEASNGQEALRLAAKDKPDVAIIDISMLVMNGVDAAREMRESSPKTKVILLRQHDEDQYVTEALRAGVKDTCSRTRPRTISCMPSEKSPGDPFMLARASHGRLLTLICPKRMTRPIPFQGASARFFS